MKVHFIKFEDNKNIAYFPETRRILKINNKAVKLIESINNKNCKYKILSEFKITSLEYENYLKK